MFGWPIVAIGLFARLGMHRGALATVFFGWMFLPVASIDLPGLPAYDRSFAISAALVAGVTSRGGLPRGSLQLTLWDVPVLVLFLAPAMASLRNGYGIYDAISALFIGAVGWLIPYVVGRALFGDPRRLPLLAEWLVIGGMFYIPVCLFELRFSPQLHRMVYGFSNISWQQVIRYGGYRPTGFMTHGLMVGMWMAVGTLAAFWLWKTRHRTEILGLPIKWVALSLLGTTILCKSVGAIGLMLVGLLLLFDLTRTGKRRLLYVFAGLPVFWVIWRVQNPEGVNSIVETIMAWDAQRAESFEFRAYTENIVIQDAFPMRPYFGWSYWGVRDPAFMAKTARLAWDSFWIITLMGTGLFGLAGAIAIYTVPVLRLMVRKPKVLLATDPGSSVLLLIVCGSMFLFDHMLNSMSTMVHPVMLGAATRSLGWGRDPGHGGL